MFAKIINSISRIFNRKKISEKNLIFEKTYNKEISLRRLLKLSILGGYKEYNIRPPYIAWLSMSIDYDEPIPSILKKNDKLHICIDSFYIVLGSFVGYWDTLITEWENGHIYFVDGLVNYCFIHKLKLHLNGKDVLISHFNECSYYTSIIRKQWVLMPTSERVDWFFNIFLNLLNGM